jgi:choline dehydrogenase-like flavoprotein
MWELGLLLYRWQGCLFMNNSTFDVIIIGSGFGGAAAAYELAKSNKKVLVVERGGVVKRDNLDWNSKAILVNQRYESDSFWEVKQYNQHHHQKFGFREVVGGNSIFYGGAALRLNSNDMKSWPVSYETFEPYYRKAEQLLEVHGDSNEYDYKYPYPSLPLNKPAQRLFDAAKKRGLKPYKLPLAINFENKNRTTCIQCNTCDGFPCKIKAKNDVTQTLLKKALASGAVINSNTIVEQIGHDNGCASSIQCVDKKTKSRFKIKGKVILIAAGSIATPLLLINSNITHKYLGKYLMRHCNGIVSCVFPFRTNPEQIFHKQLLFMDYYEKMRQEFSTAIGCIQDIYMPASDVIRHFAPRGLKTLAGIFRPFIQNLLCIAEDDPQVENCVMPSQSQDRYGMRVPQITHRYSVHDVKRRKYLEKQASKILKSAGGMFPQKIKIDSFSHAIGTTRFGTSVDNSVLDNKCKLWGMKNVYVVDGAFMPTSGGVNPSLTITANALRVAEHVAQIILEKA